MITCHLSQYGCMWPRGTYVEAEDGGAGAGLGGGGLGSSLGSGLADRAVAYVANTLCKQRHAEGQRER